MASLIIRASSSSSSHKLPMLLNRVVGFSFLPFTIATMQASTGLSSVNSSCSNSATVALPPEEFQSYKLLKRVQVSPDSCVLKFELPPSRNYLGSDPTLPTCISVAYHDEREEAKKKDLKKSYSPISHPSTPNYFDLLVKAYPYRPGGGVGAYLCELSEGDSILASLKSKRIMHGSPLAHQRWRCVGLVGGGTGIAPLYQLVQILLNDPEDYTKEIKVLSINRSVKDILMKAELDELAKRYPGRFSVSYSITGDYIEGDGEYLRGRGDVKMALKALPPPSSDDDTMIFVCGRDGFVSSWGGPVGRGPPKADGKKGPKIQGPLLGILKDAGYREDQVFKY